MTFVPGRKGGTTRGTPGAPGAPARADPGPGRLPPPGPPPAWVRSWRHPGTRPGRCAGAFERGWEGGPEPGTPSGTPGTTAGTRRGVPGRRTPFSATFGRFPGPGVRGPPRTPAATPPGASSRHARSVEVRAGLVGPAVAALRPPEALPSIRFHVNQKSRSTSPRKGSRFGARRPRHRVPRPRKPPGGSRTLSYIPDGGSFRPKTGFLSRVGPRMGRDPGSSQG